MSTTMDQIKTWLERGVNEGATHMIVVCDTFDYNDYPVFVSAEESVAEKATEHCKNMQKVIEVYDLSMDFGRQLAEHRAFHGWSPHDSVTAVVVE